MAQAARVRYESNTHAAPRRQPQHQARPRVRVIPGGAHENPALRGISPQAARLFKVAIAAILFIAFIGFGRVALSAATVENLEHVQTLESQLKTAQANGNELEIQHSVLASSSRIESKAKALGMVQPDKVTYLTVSTSSGTGTAKTASAAKASTSTGSTAAAASSN